MMPRHARTTRQVPGPGQVEPAVSVPPPVRPGTVARRPEDPSPFEEAAYRAGLAEGFHRAWLAAWRYSPLAARPVLDEALRWGLTGEDVTRQ